MTAMAIRARGLGVTVKKTRLLADVDLDIAAGEWLSIIGPNGAGKSTLLRALAGALRATGSVEIDGRPLEDLTRRERGRMVAWVPQSPTIPVGMRVFDYVLLGRTPHLGPLAPERAEDLDAATAAIEKLDLGHLADRHLDTLSGGELQRAMVGRALAQESPVLLLDEPTSALDLGHQQEVLELLERLRSTGERTIITTMHDLTLAGSFADRLVLLACGEVVEQGSAKQVLTEENLAKYYGARVRVIHEDGRVLVTPELGRSM
ncbi:MAG: ABC transporter ATP-binding protein [Actinomycetota bacterium]